MKTDILIVGGGLSGLYLAWQLEQQGRDYVLVEARDRFGGRIQSEKYTNEAGTGYFDLGPAWFWPGQPRIAKLIAELGLKQFDQYYKGDLVYEDEAGRVHRGRGHASMQGSFRLDGSLTALMDALVDQLPRDRLFKNQKVSSLSLKNMITAQTHGAHDKLAKITASKVVLALPPRVAEARIIFSPELSSQSLTAMRNVPTWMAGHAKILAIYDTAFWREDGLSGDAMSRRGPMIEIHDASPADGGPYALFGFLGIPAQVREKHRDEVLEAARQQLARIFGPTAGNPVHIVQQDWAFEVETATKLDHAALSYHPQYGLPDGLDGLWDNRLIFGSTEVAAEFGGYLEGALEAADAAFESLSEKDACLDLKLNPIS